jgi:hypothetical protein
MKLIAYRCSFCGAPETRTRLVHGPMKACICIACITTAAVVVNGQLVLEPKIRRTWRPRAGIIARWNGRGLPEC